MIKKILGLAIGCLLCGINFAQETPIYLDESKPLEERVEDALARLTLEEKVALCHAQSKFSSRGVPRLGIPELWMSDGPHGVRQEIEWDSWKWSNWTSDSCTAFPALTALAASFNPEMAYLYGKALGEEARYRKKDVILGPGVNIYRHPFNGRNFEYMGEDPFLASVMVVPYIHGVQSNGVAACVKHYALNNQETDRHDVNVTVSDRALREIYLPAFEAAVKKGHAWSFMGSYNRYLGEQGCHNSVLMQQILKQEWGFDGAVISDWGGTYDTRQAALNGLDLEMGTGTDGLVKHTANAYDNYHLAIPYLKAIQKGEIPEATVNDKARRILRLIFRTNMNTRRPWGSFATEEHAAVSRRIAEEGIVLLKNKDCFLPLKGAKTIAVIGENATRSMTVGGGSSELKVWREISPLQGIRNRFEEEAKIIHTMGYGSGPSSYGRVNPSPYDADSLKQEAIRVAATADVVLFIGGLNKSHEQDCEAGDRTQLNLPFGQDELIEALLKVNKNVVVVLVSGNAVAMPWIDRVPAVVQAWYGGSEAGNAIAAVLSGDVNPSGKLPFSFPVKAEDNGALSFGEKSFPGVDKEQTYFEDIFVGYRWHDKQAIEPLFPFGHGLSYTAFEYGKASADHEKYGQEEMIRISFELKNTGTVAGAETAQLYAGLPGSSIDRAIRELKGFSKVYLEPGESRRIEIEVPVSKLAYWNETQNGWAVEPGKYRFEIGTSSRDIRQTVSVSVQ